VKIFKDYVVAIEALAEFLLKRDARAVGSSYSSSGVHSNHGIALTDGVSSIAKPDQTCVAGIQQ
jgi:hypothetical protein